MTTANAVVPNVSTSFLAAVSGKGPRNKAGLGEWSTVCVWAKKHGPDRVSAASAHTPTKATPTRVGAGRQHLLDVLDGQRGVQQPKNEEGCHVLAHQHRVEPNHRDVGCRQRLLRGQRQRSMEKGAESRVGSLTAPNDIKHHPLPRRHPRCPSNPGAHLPPVLPG